MSAHVALQVAHDFPFIRVVSLAQLAKRKEKKGKYRHQNNWLEDDDFEDDFDSELDLFGEEEEEDFVFDDELDVDFENEYDEDSKDEKNEEEEYDEEDNY